MHTNAPAPTGGRRLIFISFRGSDSGSYAAVYLDEILPRAFGAENVFRSSRAIPAGAAFPAALDAALRAARVLLVLIGRDWAGPDGLRRIDEPGDWVRREIAESLRAGIPVIPVLLSGAGMPQRDTLPADIADLADRQAVFLRHRHIELDARHLIEQIRTAAPAAAGGPPRPAPPARFRTLIAEKTRGFVGRVHVFRAIDEWFASNPNGYLTVRADPGVGKSAIVARYAERTSCVVHFNQRATGIVHAGQLLGSLREQLGVPASNDGLPELLEQFAPRSAGQRLVIAIDALDEIDTGSQDSRANIMYLPPQLPDGVYFLLTRRDVPVQLIVDVPSAVLDLMAPRFEADNLTDIREYLTVSARTPAIAEWISELGMISSSYVETLAQRSRGNFMYLRYVIQDIGMGRMQGRRLNTVPEGLQSYYEGHWQLMGMAAAPLPRTRLKVLYVMLEYEAPVSVRQLAAMSGESATGVAEVLREWRQFLRREGDDPEPLYSLYHESFADFLRREEVIAASRIDLEEINGLIADHLYQDRHGSTPAP